MNQPFQKDWTWRPQQRMQTVKKEGHSEKQTKKTIVNNKGQKVQFLFKESAL